MNTAEIEALMARAVASGQTDDDQEQSVSYVALGARIEQAMFEAHLDCGGKLSSQQVMRTLAIVLGLTIQANRNGGPQVGALIAYELFQIILHAATGAEGELRGGLR